MKRCIDCTYLLSCEETNDKAENDCFVSKREILEKDKAKLEIKKMIEEMLE